MLITNPPGMNPTSQRLGSTSFSEKAYQRKVIT